MVEPDDVDDLGHELRSVEILKPSLRWVLRSNIDQIRPIVDFERPDRCAIEARDQCAALRGFSSNVAVTTSSTVSSRI